MADLTLRHFGRYFEAIHGHRPFPWQTRLLAEVVRTGRWPALLDLPTGTGKTAAIDVGLFHLALDVTRSTAPRRIVMVVDRRTVVDQAFERAEKIREKLRGATDGVLRIVADRLRALSGTDVALETAQLRGGMPRDDAWAKRPDQPLVAVSTVDQVGSRLLFRGYGVSEAMRPIHAGLLGNDTLVLLDEVHLSQPFRETLASIRRYRAWAGGALPDRWQVVEMSATPGGERGFRLSEDDHRDEYLVKRLGAKKPAELVEVKVGGDETARRSTFADACAERAVLFAKPGRVVGVIVNRVATAREIQQRLRDHVRVFLVTGRMRPLDRDALDDELRDLVRSDRDRPAGAAPIMVVSTQCIEAGADFDFDAIVTECASLDALRQRFGRLNRLGAIDDARGVVLARSDHDDEDPIYGEALAKTWQWLGKKARDFGIEAMDPVLPEGKELEDLLAPKDRAPVMLPAHLDAWAETRPVPVPDPDVALWLHGALRKQEPEVQIVWRADLTEALLAAAMDAGGPARDAVVKRVEACAPVGLEALAVPIYAARAWLAREAAERGAEVADIEGSDARAKRRDERPGKKPRASRPALLWKGDESEVIAADGLRPGATIVVPSTYGGIADGGWDPTSKAPVSDLGDLAHWKQTGRPTLRLHPAVVDPVWAWGEIPRPGAEDDASTNDGTAIATWLDAMKSASASEPWRREVLDALAKGKRRRAVVRLDAVGEREEAGESPLPNGYFVLVGRGRAGDGTTEDDGASASYTGVAEPLRTHLRGVAGWARHFADRCGLSADLVADVALAGLWHDTGKVDPRFQRMLHGGSAYKAEVAAEPLAKSEGVAADRAARARAFERSGYPRGARHELASVALMLAAGAPLLSKAKDPDLVLHLVASHHGWCRPFAPVVADEEPVGLTLDTEQLVLDLGGVTVRVASNHALAQLGSGIAERFWRLVARYGWFGLAWLEAILRLADHRRSEEEEDA